MGMEWEEEKGEVQQRAELLCRYRSKGIEDVEKRADKRSIQQGCCILYRILYLTSPHLTSPFALFPDERRACIPR
jgi:hypothetical protein